MQKALASQEQPVAGRGLVPCESLRKGSSELPAPLGLDVERFIMLVAKQGGRRSGR